MAAEISGLHLSGSLVGAVQRRFQAWKGNTRNDDDDDENDAGAGGGGSAGSPAASSFRSSSSSSSSSSSFRSSPSSSSSSSCLVQALNLPYDSSLGHEKVAAGRKEINH